MEDRLRTILDLQSQGYSKKEIAKKMGYSRSSSLSSWMKRRQYIYNEVEQKYIHQEVKESTILGHEMQDKMIKIAKQYNDFQDMLEWFRTRERQVSSNQKTEVINKGIQISLPKVESIKTSIRVNKEIWKEFGRFAEDHSEFVKGDLLCQALHEFMNKYK